ncbi:glycosyltransferase family 31 protein [Hypoxylon sp. FL1284]|nr:glycosyltransferase family 31 protein [Hypoxylon sp. FL1284]
MFPSKLSRLLLVTSVVLLFVFTYTTLYLHHSVPQSYPSVDPQVAPIEDAVPIHEEPQVGYDAAIVKTTSHETPAPDPSNPTPSPIPTLLSEESPHEPDTKGPPAAPAEQVSIAHVQDDHQEEGWLPLPDPKACAEDLEFLVRAGIDLELTGRVRYTRRYIRPDFSGGFNRDEVANVTETLIQGDVEVDLYSCGNTVIPQSAPIELRVPQPHRAATFTHFIFGIASEYSRLNDSIRPLSHWISGTGAKLVAAVTDAREKTPGEMEELEQNFHMVGINATLVRPMDDSFTTSQNHFSVLVNMLEYGNSDTRWYGLLDDDTFFPSLNPLSDRLDTLDHSVDTYVGALSEDLSAVRNFGIMAFGGAGVFLSPPLAKKLGDEAVLCMRRATRREGDVIIGECVYSISKAKLTILPGLYQQDMRGDVSGFFEAGLRPLNLHHWKSWYRAPVEQMAKAAKFCGDCFLQRWRFGTDTVFANGFSIATYRDGVESVDLHSMEGTWSKAGRNYDFSVGPLRDAYPADEKKSYRLREAEFAENGDLRQLYVYVGDSLVGELDHVVELIWQEQ